jgi:hypothetical protein
MNTRSRFLLLAVSSALILGLLSLSDARSGGAPGEAKFRLPDAAFDELILESNKYLQEEIKSENPGIIRVRANALMIALASQHRMAPKKPNLDQLATMRDAAVRIARAVDLNGDKNDLATVRKQAALLAEYPSIKPDPNAIMEILRLKSVFEQEDVDFHFKNKNKQVAIERELFALYRTPPPVITAQVAAKYEMIGYKLALLADQLRDFDENVRVHKFQRRKEWVAHATDVQYNGWELAEVFRSKNAPAAKAVVERINNACSECHSKFRCD